MTTTPNYKVAIVGSRDYPDMQVVESFVENLYQGRTERGIEYIIISGGARGVDTVAQNTAIRLGMKVEIFPADWENEGKKAGYLRNIKIVEAADYIVAFWDTKSKGTKHTIDLAKKMGKPCLVFESKEEKKE